MASSSTSAAVREMQKDLEVQANALSKIQKGKHALPASSPPPNQTLGLLWPVPLLSADISKNHQVRKQYTIQVGENELVLKARTRSSLLPFASAFQGLRTWWVPDSDLVSQELELLDDGANVYKLIGPVLVKQDLAEAKANVKKRIEYISAELWVAKRLYDLSSIDFP
jgi:prefoldin beta subunit